MSKQKRDDDVEDTEQVAKRMRHTEPSPEEVVTHDTAVSTAATEASEPHADSITTTTSSSSSDNTVNSGGTAGSINAATSSSSNSTNSINAASLGTSGVGSDTPVIEKTELGADATDSTVAAREPAAGEPAAGEPAAESVVAAAAAAATGSIIVHKFQHKNAVFAFGNYRKYYGYRTNGQKPQNDPRLAMLDRSWFEGKACLDIGCNSGLFSTALAMKFQVKSMLGVDIDASLIAEAQNHVKWRARTTNKFSTNVVGSSPPETAEGNGFPYFPVSCELSIGRIDDTASVAQFAAAKRMEIALKNEKSNPFDFPYNVSFRAENFVSLPPPEHANANLMGDLSNAATFTPEDEKFDVIICLSVTKWVHMNWGDLGIQELFAKVYRMLLPGGRFLVEPQLWSSYKKKKGITKHILRTVNGIQLKPDDFKQYLLDKVGFRECQEIAPSVEAGNLFDRPMLLLTK